MTFGTWNEESDLIAATITAFLLGALFSYLANTDRFHRIVRRLGITRETSFPSEWFGAFLKNITYIVLHLKTWENDDVQKEFESPATDRTVPTGDRAGQPGS